MLAMFGMAVFASFASFWPYNLSLDAAKHYALGLVDAEVGVAFVNSLKIAAWHGVFGTVLVFVGAYLLEKTRGADWLRPAVQLLAMLPMAVPGLVLGLGYIFFFNARESAECPLPHDDAAGAVHDRPLLHHRAPYRGDGAEGARRRVRSGLSASLKVPFCKTFWRVTLPICMPALIDMARYFFINAMTTISAVVFLYSPETKLASIAILQPRRGRRNRRRRRHGRPDRRGLALS